MNDGASACDMASRRFTKFLGGGSDRRTAYPSYEGGLDRPAPYRGTPHLGEGGQRGDQRKKALVFAVIGVLMFVIPQPSPEGMEPLPPVPPIPTDPLGEYFTYALDAVNRTDGDFSTTFYFADDGMFYRLFSAYNGKLGLRITDCSGLVGAMFIRAGDFYILNFTYEGQSLLAIGGWTSTSYNRTGGIIRQSRGGMDVLSEAWKLGLWSPDHGITITNQGANFGDAELTVLYSVPHSIIPTGGGLKKCKV
jgi:hypothetical protein